MKKTIIILAFIIIPKGLFAVGESAVITLAFPAGAENCALGESGVSHAKNIYTVFWNPANLPAVYDENMTNFTYGSFNEGLLPSFRIPDLYHDYNTFGLFLNDIFPYTDLSYAFFKNFINMGENEISDSLGFVTDTFKSDETVISNSLAFRLFDIISLGVSFKKYESRLAPGMGLPDYPDDGIATGNAFDIGIRAGKRFNILNLFEVEPAVGVSFLNLGSDSAKYIDTSENYDPLPKMVVYGGSANFNILGLFEYTIIYEEDYSFVSKKTEIIEHFGHRFQITPFYSIQRGHMYDEVGARDEIEAGYTKMFNFQKTLNMVYRLVKLHDYVSGQDKWQKMKDVEEKLSIGGLKFKPNFYYSKSHSEIYPQGSNDARKGQVRDDYSLGFGIIGSFPNFFPKNKDVRRNELDTDKTINGNESKDAQKKNDGLIMEEDGELVE